MIEKMKKLTFLVTAKEYEPFLLDLREAGVVHVQELQQGATSPALQEALSLTKRYEDAMQRMENVLKTYEQAGEVPALPSFGSPLELLEHIEALEEERTRLLHVIDSRKARIEQLTPWGEFSLEELERIEANSKMRIRFFSCPNKLFKKEWEEAYFATPIDEVQKRIYFLTFSEEMPDITAEHIERPQHPISFYQASLRETESRVRLIEQELLALAGSQMHILAQGLCAVQNEVRLDKVRLSSEAIADGVVHLMTGWTLVERLPELEERLKARGIYYEAEDPAFGEDVPIKIRNGAFSRLFEPILRMYSLPSYTDLDPTETMAPFFLVFFGLCMGDAGYGLLITLAGLFITFSKPALRDYGKLATWLGCSTIVCGLLTGTVFGISLPSQPWAFLDPVRPFFLTKEGVGPIFGYDPMMVISVIIGLVQVLLGMVLKGVKAWLNYGWQYAVGTFSWVVALLLLIVVFGLPACGVVLPAGLQYMLTGVLALSCIGIYLFNNPAAYSKNRFLAPFLNLGGGLWATYGMSTGLLGDLLSYIRLFALGLTGGVLGGVFNSLATEMTEGLPVGVNILVMLLILLIGHGLTFALSMISAFVHPMRLTFVEFFKNADFNGGGKEYDPFRRIDS